MQEREEGKEKDYGVKVLAFDLYGTLVDLDGTITDKVDKLGRGLDGVNFAHLWREKYGEWIEKVHKKEIGWVSLARLVGLGLQELLNEFNLTDLTPNEIDDLKNAWTSPKPFPDVKEGLDRLRKKGYILATISNAGDTMQREIAKSIGIEFDHYFSSDKVQAFKPDPLIFNQALSLSFPPRQVMMVAESMGDLNSAASELVGFQTAYIHRTHKGPVPPGLPYTLIAQDIRGLIDQLGG